jgi:hypothetical protein
MQGLPAVDPDSEIGAAVEAFKSDLIEDLGGEDAVSTQQRALVELAAREWLMLESIDGWILEKGRFVNTGKRSAFPIVRERFKMADSFSRRLNTLGLERRAKPVPTLESYLAEKSQENGADEAEAEDAADAVVDVEAEQG